MCFSLNAFFFLPSQNLVLPECFFSFVDLKKEFHKCCSNADPVQTLDLDSMLECILCHAMRSTVAIEMGPNKCS